MAMDPQGAKETIKDRFAAEYEDDSPTLEAVLSQKTEAIVAARKAAALTFSEVAYLTLAPEQCQALQGKRLPESDHIADLLAQGLIANPDIEQQVGFGGKLFSDAALADRAAGRLILSGQRLAQGGEVGSLLTAGLAHALCERVLSGARAALADPKTTPEQRAEVEIALSEAFRQKASAQERLQDEAARFDEVAAGPQAAIDRTAEEAASSRLIDGFFAWVKKQGGGA